MQTLRLLVVLVGALSATRPLPAGERTERFDRDPNWSGHNNRAENPKPRTIRQATRLVQFDPLPVAAVLGPPFAVGVVDEDTTHGFGRGGEEVAAAVPELGLFHIYESEIRLMDQGRGLQRLAGLFLSEPLGSEFAEFVVDQRQELLGSERIALLDGGQDASHFIHGRHRKN